MKIISSYGRKGFFLDNEGEVLFEATNKNWFSSTIYTIIGENQIHFSPKNIWGKTFLIYRNGEVKGNIEFNWKGTMKLHLLDLWDIERIFLLKPHGFFKKHFELTDEQENIIFEINPSFDWSRFKQNFDLNNIRVNYHENTLLELIFFSICAVKVYIQKQSAAASA